MSCSLADFLRSLFFHGAGGRTPVPLGIPSRPFGAFEALEPRRLLAEYAVTTPADVVDAGDGLTSLREAIEQANTNPGADTIVFDEGVTGTIPLTSTVDTDGQTDLDITDSVAINGPGADKLTIDGNFSSRVFHVDDNAFGSEISVIISGLTITHGQPPEGEDGGGVYSVENLTLSFCVVTDNQTRDRTVGGGGGGYGGGICSFGTLRLTACTVSNNQAGDGRSGGSGGSGGGIWSQGTLMLRYCTVSGNKSGNGDDGGRVGAGGGIGSEGTLTLTDCTVSGNQTGNGDGLGGGGGIACQGTLTLTNCTVSGNHTGDGADGGGGIASVGTLEITNCTISDNWTGVPDSRGGGLFCWAVETDTNTIHNSTITGNAADEGGGIYLFGGHLSLGSTIVAGNTAGAGPDFFRGEFGATATADHSLIGNNADSGFTPDPDGPNFIGEPGSLIDPLLGPLTNNGGRTNTRALLAGSPATDRGAVYGSLDFDQRRGPFARANAPLPPDIGAYERQTTALPALVVDTAEDENDGDYRPGDLSLREAVGLANGSIGPDAISFHSALNGQTIRLDYLGGGSDLQITDALTITGPGADQLTIHGNDTSRVFRIDDGDETTQIDVTLSGLEITHGTPAEGQHGGGIYSIEHLMLESCTITANETRDRTVSGGSGGFGGGICSSGTLVLTDCTVFSNQTGDGGPGAVGGAGGGICSQGTLTLTRCTVSGNQTGDGGPVGGFGGGIWSSGTLTMTGCTVSGNQTGEGDTGGFGGGIDSTGTVEITNCTISGNSTPVLLNSRGGGLRCRASDTDTITIRNSTITDNSAYLGGGIYHQTGILSLGSTIVAENTGTSGPDFFLGTGATSTADRSLIGNNLDSDFPADPDGPNYIGEPGNEIDPLLGPLANNGGPTNTHALLLGSPAVDQGAVYGALSFDQRGGPFARANSPSAPDIGAYERQTVALPPLVVNTTVDEADGDYSSGDLSLREAIGLANGSVGADTVSFHTSLNGQTIRLDYLGGGYELEVTDSLTITGLGADQLTIHGNESSRAFRIDDGDDSAEIDITMSGLRITHGNPGEAHSGGAVYSDENLALENCVIASSKAGDGTDRLLWGGSGGGIWSRGTLTLIGCIVSKNRTGDSSGGGGGSGGGISSQGTLTLIDCTVADNQTGDGGFSGLGGGIWSYGTMTLSGCTVVGNQTGDGDGGRHGAGIYTRGTVEITNCTITGNSTQIANAQGGGLRCRASETEAITIRNTTITDNSADLGGGIYHDLGALSLGSTIVAQNTATAGPDFFLDTGATATADRSLIGNNLDSEFAADPDGPNYIGDPDNAIDPLLGPLADNGGITETHAVLLGSPALDHGTTYGALDFDQRGAPFARADALSLPDIGAYERQTAVLPPLVVDTAADEKDGDYSSGDLSFREAIGLANGSVGPETVSFHSSLNGQTIRLDYLGGGYHLEITDELTITGLGADQLTVDGNNTSRIFYIYDGDSTTDFPAIITGLRITNGNPAEGNYGGGVYSREDLTMERCVVTGNQTRDRTVLGGWSGFGGGICAGNLSLTDCTVSGNRTGEGSFGGVGGNGGGVLCSGDVTLVNCTISGNRTGKGGSGGGIRCSAFSSESVSILNSTITGNRADEGGGIYHSVGFLSLDSTIVANNIALTSGPDFYLRTEGGARATADRSLIGNNADSGFDPDPDGPNFIGDPGNVIDPLLAPLANNGGPTQTHALLPGSLAIDNGANTLGLPDDQRGAGFNRQSPPGYPADIGAYENQYQTEFLGPVDYRERDFDLAHAGVWCGLETTQDGFLTLEAFDPGVDFRLLDQRGEELERSNLYEDRQRIDYVVETGETYYFKLLGSGAVHLRLGNLVQHTGTTVTAHGTDEADEFEYAPSGSHQVTVKGIDYHFDDSEVTKVQFRAGAGADSANLYGSAGSETLTIRPTTASLRSDRVDVSVVGAERVIAAGGGGHDTANFHGTADTDVYTGTQSYGRLTRDGFFARASGFAECYVDLNLGDDIARLYDSPGDDTLTANPTQATLSCPAIDVLHQVENFRELHAFATEDGNDTAELADDPAEASYVVSFHALSGTEGKLFDGDRTGAPDEVNQVFLIRTSGFDSVTATAGPGDTALLYGTSGDDQYSGTASQASLTVPSGSVFTAVSFEQVHSVAKGGKNDTAEIVGSPERERFWGTRVYGRLGGSGWLQRLVRYNRLTAYGGGGPDVAEMFDTRFTDTFSGWPDQCVYQAGRWEYRVQDFPVLRVNGEAAGSDVAHLYPGAGDTVSERTNAWAMSGDGYSITVEKAFGAVEVHDGPGPVSVNALAAPDEFSPGSVSDHDLAILAYDLVHEGATGETDDERAAIDSVLRTEFRWLPSATPGKRLTG
jgi:CSLREA domain-containing protein